MIYLDTSVALAELLAEDRKPPAALWEQPLVASKLLEYELSNRLHAHKRWRSHGNGALVLLHRVSLVALAPEVLERALLPFPAPVRTLDALHLATALYLHQRSAGLTLATYDQDLARAAKKVGLRLFAL